MAHGPKSRWEWLVNVIKPDRGTTPFKELKNGSVDVDVLQKMKELKRMIQFDDPACLLFTSVSLQNRFYLKNLRGFQNKNALWFRALEWGATVRLLRTRGALRRRLSNHNVFRKQDSQVFFFKRNNNIHKLRALSWEVRCVQTVLKFSTVG